MHCAAARQWHAAGQSKGCAPAQYLPMLSETTNERAQLHTTTTPDAVTVTVIPIMPANEEDATIMLQCDLAPWQACVDAVRTCVRPCVEQCVSQLNELSHAEQRSGPSLHLGGSLTSTRHHL
ncbi:hypothetical protein NDU88_000173 [Pleurodeles waltl]|uniref:Uncharacterized protein n=1 Tax=Pleurodeles waltl TaxID=8319 RepID=A0AAV7WGQ6_PLEWA|nr:hypothetical protein NDU88_000173 [Pleurodeles waltl]